MPDSVLADAFFPKGGYKATDLFDRIAALLHELPTRPRPGKPSHAAIWVQNAKGTIAVTCPECLRTFPLIDVNLGINVAECDFCGSSIRFEMIPDAAGRALLRTEGKSMADTLPL